MKPSKTILLITIFLFSFTAVEAYSIGLGDFTRPLSKSFSRIDPTNPGSVTSPIKKYKITIRNTGNKGIHYRLDGRPDLIGSGRSKTWTIKDTSSTMQVNFDNGNSQNVKYAVGSGKYVFKWKNGVLDLFKD